MAVFHVEAGTEYYADFLANHNRITLVQVRLDLKKVAYTEDHSMLQIEHQNTHKTSVMYGSVVHKDRLCVPLFIIDNTQDIHTSAYGDYGSFDDHDFENNFVNFKVYDKAGDEISATCTVDLWFKCT